MTNSGTGKRITWLKYVFLMAAMATFVIEYTEPGDLNGKTVAGIGTVFVLLSILRDTGDPSSKFKKWFSRVVLLIVVLLTLILVVGDVVWMLMLDVQIEVSDIRLWAGAVLVVIVGFVEMLLSKAESTSTASTAATPTSPPTVGGTPPVPDASTNG